MSKYGHFSPSGDEYIVTNPNTPRAWVNFLSNKRYCALVTATGGGYSFVDDTRYNRLTREVMGETTYEDRPGRYIFIRDNDSGQVWSVNWQPMMKPYQNWESVHGLGYTRITSKSHDIDSEITYFVPLKDTLEIWDFHLKNNSKKMRNLSVYTYIEWSLGYFQKDMVDRNFDVLFNSIYCENNTIFATKSRTERPDNPGTKWDTTAFLTGDVSFDGWECSKNKFLGADNYLDHPDGLYTESLTNSNAIGEDGVGVLRKDFHLKPGQGSDIAYILGVAPTKTQALKSIRAYRSRSKIRREYQALRTFWEGFTKKIQVLTPDHGFNMSLNYWNKYQTWVTSVWGESDSLYIGASDVGFRDECQHIYGILPLDEKLAKTILVELLENQYTEGYVNHNWNRTTKKGTLTHHSDDTQWLVMAILNYIEETAHFDFLLSHVSYQDGGDGTIFEHMVRAMDYTLYHFSPNGIPLRRTADWNDALAGGHLGRGESLMVANQVCWNIKRLVELLHRIHDLDNPDFSSITIDSRSVVNLSHQYQHVYERVRETVNHDFWDGHWYIRATDDSGAVVGSHKNKEGKIHLDGQTWAVMSGLADEVRGVDAMNSVWSYLDTPYGPCIFLPSYTHYSHALGIISQFAPGTKENGTIFSHLVAWSVIAECILGRGDKAYEVWKKSSFVTRGEDPDVYQTEPYVYSEFIYGPENANFGAGSYSWMTGSAAWFLRACTDWILGVRPTYDGLFIDPCIPKVWKSFKITREFRGTRYDITVQNPKGVNKGVVSITVNGKPIKGSLVIHKGGPVVDVDVVMG